MNKKQNASEQLIIDFGQSTDDSSQHFDEAEEVTETARTAEPKAAAMPRAPRKAAPKTHGGKKLTKKQKELIAGALPVDEQTFIITPLTFTYMSQDYSAMQNKVITYMLEKLQDVLRNLINNKMTDISKLAHLQAGDIKNDHGLSINLYFKDFAVNKNHYPELRSALSNLAVIPVSIPYKSPEGRKYKKVTNLCDVYIPEGARNPYVNIHMDEEIAKSFVSVELGYHMLGADTVYNTRNKYTQRLFLLISAWMDKTDHVTLRTDTFRQILNIGSKYKAFRHVIQRVLDPAHDELKELAQLGYCACYFEYEKVYNGRRRAGEPDAIRFWIYKSPKLLEKKDSDYAESGQRQYFSDLLGKYFRMPRAKAEELARCLSRCNYNQAMAKMMQLHTYVSRPGLHITDVANYVYRSMLNFFQEEERKTYIG